MKKLFTIATLLLLTSCASIATGDRQIVAIETPNCEGADCTLKNEQGEYYAKSTPSSITINRSASSIFLECSKGKYKETVTIESDTKAMAFGNLVAGGIVGAAIDMSTGAAYVYPDVLTNPLKCK